MAVINLDTGAESELFAGRFSGLVLTCYENERPLQGLAGLIDWRVSGALSLGLRRGLITGKPGECVYVPVSRNNVTYHFIMAGCGLLPVNRTRIKIPPETIKRLRANLLSLRLSAIGVSRSDCGNIDESWCNQNLRGLPICLVQ